MGIHRRNDERDTPAPSEPQSSKPPSVALGQADEEAQTQEIDIEALGRQRPAVFGTIWSELGFCFSLVASMLMAVCRPSRSVLSVQN